MAQPTATRWWILTGGFARSPLARRFSGPYSTRDDALTARVTIERLRKSNDLFVDSISEAVVSDPLAKVES